MANLGRRKKGRKTAWKNDKTTNGGNFETKDADEILVVEEQKAKEGRDLWDLSKHARPKTSNSGGGKNLTFPPGANVMTQHGHFAMPLS